MMESSSANPSKQKKKTDRAFLHDWASLLGNCLFEIRTLTFNYLFARELYPLKDQYMHNGILARNLDIRSLFAKAKDPVVKELEYLLANGVWILERFAESNDYQIEEFFTQRESFEGFIGPDNWKHPPKNEEEYRSYVPDQLLAFLIYSASTLFEKSNNYVKDRGVKLFHFNPEKLPADINRRNATLVAGAIDVFSEAMLNIGQLRMQERN